MPEMGTSVYRLTQGPMEHKHMYHVASPWSSDQTLLVLMRYDRNQSDAEICVQDAGTGELRVVGRSSHWNTHSTAMQKWQGDSGRIFYEAAKQNGSVTVVSVFPDGSEERRFTTTTAEGFLTCSPDGRYAYGATPLRQMFPDDKLAPREDKGVMRLDLETGQCELVFSVAQAVAFLPEAGDLTRCHLYCKMMLPHPRSGRLLFNLVNSFWDRAGSEPRVRALVTVNPDGSKPVHLGRALHHPNWHPTENRVVVNVKDFNGVTRLGLYNGDGTGLLEYVPATKGSGHPTFSPDGQWLFTDGRSYPDGTSYAIFCDPKTGREIVGTVYKAISAGYATFKAIDERRPGESVAAALERSEGEAKTTRQTHGHPAWSRDGSAVLFNADLGDGSQLYAVDVHRTLAKA